MKIKPHIYMQAGVKRTTSRLYADFIDHQGIRRKLPLFTDMRNSTEAGRQIERLVDIRASGDSIPQELRRFIENCPPRILDRLSDWQIVESSRVASVKSLEEHLADWKDYLIAKDNTAEHCNLVHSRVKKLFELCGFKNWVDIRAEAVQTQLKEWRSRTERPMSRQTSNFYVVATKSFARWMINIARRATESPLLTLTTLNAKADRRHDRRAYSVDEFVALLNYLSKAPARMKIPARDRAMIYLTAIETGLRRSAIAAITPRALDLESNPPRVFVAAGAANKYKEQRWVALRQSTAALLKKFVAGKDPDARVFRFPSKGHGAKMVKADLDAARQQWIDEAKTPELKAAREASTFLKYCDERNRHLDFHAFRHSSAVWMMLHRGASGREVQSHLGLGNLALVDRYSKSFAVENGGTIERGPEMAQYVVTDASRDAPVFRTSKPDPNLPENLPLNLPLKGTFRDTSPDSDGQTAAHGTNGHASQKLLKKAEKAGVLTKNAGSDIVLRSTGEVAEWLNAPVSKTGLRAIVAGVRISPSPLLADARWF